MPSRTPTRSCAFASELPLVHAAYPGFGGREYFRAAGCEDIDAVMRAPAALPRRAEPASNRSRIVPRDWKLERRDVFDLDGGASAAQELGLQSQKVPPVSP